MEHLTPETIRDLVLGRLTGAALAACLRHVEICAACRAQADAERTLRAVLDLGGAELAAPAPAADAAAEAVLAQVAAPAPLARWRGVLVRAAVLAALVGGLIWQVQGRTAAAAHRATPGHALSDDELAALLALRAAPWLDDDFATVQALADLLAEERHE